MSIETIPTVHRCVPAGMRDRITALLERHLESETERFWSDRATKAADPLDPEEILATVTDERVLEARLEFDHLEILARAVTNIADYLERKKRHAFATLHLLTEELLEVDPRWQWFYDRDHDVIHRRTETDHALVVEHAQLLCDMEDGVLEEVSRGVLPKSWELAAPVEWYRDLAELILEDRDAVGRRVHEICADSRAAAEAMLETGCPTPVVFVAMACRKIAAE